jgi:hypothetical protein
MVNWYREDCNYWALQVDPSIVHASGDEKNNRMYDIILSKNL